MVITTDKCIIILFTDTKNGKDPTTQGCPNAVAFDNEVYDQSVEVAATSFKVHTYICLHNYSNDLIAISWLST